MWQETLSLENLWCLYPSEIVVCCRVGFDCQFLDVFLLEGLDNLAVLSVVFVCLAYLFWGVDRLDEVVFVGVAGLMPVHFSMWFLDSDL